MSSTTGTNGRFGNQFIRNIAVSFLAEKFDLKVDYHNEDLIKKLGIELFSRGKYTHPGTLRLTDNNYLSIFNSDTLKQNVDPNHNYFQTKEIISMIYHYLNRPINKSTIILNNPYKERYDNNTNLLVHVRLTDAVQWNPGLAYYINAIKLIQFDKLYITTDDKSHSIITELLKLYPSAELINFDEITTIQFASTCKNLILSHGSFSAVIGYLSFYSTIHYPEYEQDKIWYGDMFSIENWIKLKTK